MGRPTEGKDGEYKTPAVQSVSVRHRAMARAQVAGGLMPKQICQLYGMTPGQYSRVQASPAFQAYVKDLEEQHELCSLDASEELIAMREQALRNLQDDLTIDASEDPKLRKLRQIASFSVLENTGVFRGKGTNINIVSDKTQVNVKGMNDDELREAVLGTLLEESENAA